MILLNRWMRRQVDIGYLFGFAAGAMWAWDGSHWLWPLVTFAGVYVVVKLTVWGLVW